MSPNIALDPNVISCFMYDAETLDFLNFFVKKLETANNGPKLARDNYKIKKAYQKDYLRLIEKEEMRIMPTVELKFLSDLLSNWSEWTIPKSADIDSSDAVSCMTGNGCSVDGLELVLIGLAANNDVTLIATNLDKPCQQKRYILHKESLIQSLRNEYLPNLRVVYSKFARTFIETTIHSNLFEDRVANWVKKHYRYRFRRVNAHYTPPYLMAKGGAGEVDIYAEDDEEPDTIRVLVGECKLRMPANSKKLVGLKEMEQLVKKIEAVNEHESARWAPNGRTTQVFGMFVSNAIGITKKAAQLARKHKIDCLQAEMSESWHRYTDWRIKHCSKLPIVKLSK